MMYKMPEAKEKSRQNYNDGYPAALDMRARYELPVRKKQAMKAMKYGIIMYQIEKVGKGVTGTVSS